MADQDAPALVETWTCVPVNVLWLTKTREASVGSMRMSEMNTPGSPLMAVNVDPPFEEVYMALPLDT